MKGRILSTAVAVFRDERVNDAADLRTVTSRCTRFVWQKASNPSVEEETEVAAPEKLDADNTAIPEGDGGDVLPDALMEEREDSEEEEDAEGDDDDDEGWITPSNIKEVKRQMGIGVAETEQSRVSVACLTTDFAMQVKRSVLWSQWLLTDGLCMLTVFFLFWFAFLRCAHYILYLSLYIHKIVGVFYACV